MFYSDSIHSPAMAHFKVLIFDFDGTLCATEAAILFTFRRTFEQRGVEAPSAERIKEILSTGANLVEILPLLHPGLQQASTSELQEWVQHYRRLYETEGGQLTTLFAGATQLLSQLQKLNMTCVVLSNKGQRAIEDALQQFKLCSYFDLIIGDNPQTPFPKKPDPAAFHQIIQPRYAQIESNQFLMIGDTPADLEFANNAGIASCWAAFGYGAPERCRQASPTFTVQNLSQVLPLLPSGT